MDLMGWHFNDMKRYTLLLCMFCLWQNQTVLAAEKETNERRLHQAAHYSGRPGVFKMKMAHYAGRKHWMNNLYYKGYKGYPYSKGKGYKYHVPKGKGYTKGKGFSAVKGKGKVHSYPLVFKATPSPYGECFADTWENGVCDKTCDFAFAGSDLCSQGQSCCAVCNQNDISTECCLSSDCEEDYACRYNQCICQHECCSANDCGDATRYSCINNQCERRDCNVLETNAQCCLDSDCPIGHVCEESLCIVEGDPRFTLTWYGDDDLDLHVIAPGGNEIHFGKAHDRFSGGELDQNAIPNQEARWVESIHFPENSISGIYTYYVRNYNQVGRANEKWYLSIHENGRQVRFHSGDSLGHRKESAWFKYIKL